MKAKNVRLSETAAGFAPGTPVVQRVASTLGVFGAGMLVGAGLAFLTAPKSGPGMREDLRERLRRAPEQIKEAIVSVTSADVVT
ncbi:MAG: hypothetical protein JWM82_2019 [Myxococcales bacterium]|nr:hypothetical protein [Myxococcales bacterium]